MILRVTVTHSAARLFRFFRSTTPTSTDRTTPVGFANKAVDGPTSGLGAAQLSRDNNVGNFAISGFVALFSETLQAGVLRDYICQGYEIPPGHAFDITLGDTTDAAGETGTFSIEWLEI